MKVVQTVIALSVGMAITASASAGNEVPIKFAPGSYCWKYEGRPGLRTFVGEFRTVRRLLQLPLASRLHCPPDQGLRQTVRS
jgi:hypothetical protein